MDDTSRFLNLPLEIRLQVYDLVYQDKGTVFQTVLSARRRRHHKCPYKPLLCCRQMYREIQHHLKHRTVRFSTVPHSKHIFSNSACSLHMATTVSAGRFLIEINPFQYMPTVPSIYSTLVMICQRLMECPESMRIEIVFDGTLPRTRAPLHINEDDLDRAPTLVVLFLYPFHLLSDVKDINIQIQGGRLDDPWAKHSSLQDFVSHLRTRMIGSQLPEVGVVDRVLRLRNFLATRPFWDGESFRDMVVIGRRCDFAAGNDIGTNREQDMRSQPICRICNNSLKSRNALFRHLAIFHGLEQGSHNGCVLDHVNRLEWPYL